MRRRRRKSVQPGVSLFPFLAVLICTLGVLIVLLVLAVKSASISKAQQESAVAQEEAELAAKEQATKQQRKAIIEHLQDEIDRHIVEAESYESVRPDAQREVAAAREYRGHLEKEILELDEQAKQLVAEMKLLDTDRDSLPEEIDDSAVEALRQQISDAQDRLATKRESVVTILSLIHI